MTISDFSNIKISSKQFIVDHYQDIDIVNFLETAQLKLSGEELKCIYQLITSISERWDRASWSTLIYSSWVTYISYLAFDLHMKFYLDR